MSTQRLTQECSQQLCLWQQASKKKPKCPSTQEWISTLWYMHMMEYYLATKRDGLLIQRNNIQESQNNYAEIKKSGSSTNTTSPKQKWIHVAWLNIYKILEIMSWSIMMEWKHAYRNTHIMCDNSLNCVRKSQWMHILPNLLISSSALRWIRTFYYPCSARV